MLPTELEFVARRTPQGVIALLSGTVGLAVLTTTRHTHIWPPVFSVLKIVDFIRSFSPKIPDAIRKQCEGLIRSFGGMGKKNH